MGSIFRIPVFENFEKCDIIYKLKKNEVLLMSTSLEGEDIFNKDISSATRLAAVFGNEAAGISPELAENADMLVKLPMSGSVESLNVAVSAGIVMYMVRMGKI